MSKEYMLFLPKFHRKVLRLPNQELVYPAINEYEEIEINTMF